MSSKNLIIVESPSKIKTLKKFLGKDYQIEASVGHIRDLAEKNLGLDIENGFVPTYIVSSKSKDVVKNLKKAIIQVLEDFKSYKIKNCNILLSPSAASFDQYKNFEVRGKEFKNLSKFHARKFL